jgi:hypothetical protein
VTPGQLALLLRGIAAVVVLAAIGWGVHTYRSAIERAEVAEAALSQATATATATAATTGALIGVQTETQRVEVVVTQGRAAAAIAVQELSDADPTVSDLRARPIPHGLRDIARARREARDRSAGAEAGGAGADRAPDPGR